MIAVGIGATGVFVLLGVVTAITLGADGVHAYRRWRRDRQRRLAKLRVDAFDRSWLS